MKRSKPLARAMWEQSRDLWNDPAIARDDRLHCRLLAHQPCYSFSQGWRLRQCGKASIRDNPRGLSVEPGWKTSTKTSPAPEVYYGYNEPCQCWTGKGWQSTRFWRLDLIQLNVPTDRLGYAASDQLQLMLAIAGVNQKGVINLEVPVLPYHAQHFTLRQPGVGSPFPEISTAFINTPWHKLERLYHPLEARAIVLAVRVLVAPGNGLPY